MAGMTKEKWIKAGLEIAEHIKALQQIAVESDMDLLSIAVFNNKDAVSFATFVDGELGDEGTVTFNVNVRNGKATLCANHEYYYVQA